MKPPFIILNGLLIISIIFLLTGCHEGSVYIDSDSKGQCVLGCNQLAEQKMCGSAYASLSQTIINGKLSLNSCECILLNCFKKIGLEIKGTINDTNQSR